MANKMTKKDYFKILRDTYPTDASNYEAVIAFIDHEVDLLNRKNSSDKKPTAQQKANEIIKKGIFEGMEGTRMYTITEIIKEIDICNGLANQKVSALMRQLRDEGLVVRIEEKRKAYFQKIVEDEEEGD